MSSTLEIIRTLLDRLEEFAKDKDEISLDAFILWLNARLFSESHAGQSAHGPEAVDMQLTFLLVMQSRYYKAYAKRVLGPSGLSSPEGFSFLYHLSVADSYRKMELIKLHNLEPPSGVEVLKRLTGKGFIVEFDDPDDKRAKRIRISEKGRNELADMMPKLSEVFRMMSAELSFNEKLHVLGFLKQMTEFHSKKVTGT